MLSQDEPPHGTGPTSWRRECMASPRHGPCGNKHIRGEAIQFAAHSARSLKDAYAQRKLQEASGRYQSGAGAHKQNTRFGLVTSDVVPAACPPDCLVLAVGAQMRGQS
jgi:hypothetical protein